MSIEQEVIRIGRQLEKIVSADQPVSPVRHVFFEVRSYSI